MWQAKGKSRFQVDTTEGRFGREVKSLVRRRWVTFYLVSLLGLSVWVSCSVTQEEGAGSEPDTPQIEISSYTDILPAAQTIIDEGHLVALDDPEVIELARKYGDPEILLREDWVHVINPVLE